MGKRTFEEEMELIGNSKEATLKYNIRLRELLTEKLLLAEGDFSEFNSILAKKDFIMTGEAYKLKTCMLIIEKEKTFSEKSIFFETVEDVDSAIEKLSYAALMFRRIEIDPCGAFSEQAYDYVRKSGISPESLLVILCRGTFEHERETAVNIYNYLSDNLAPVEKYKWLSLLGEEYKDIRILMELAELQLSYGQYRNVLNTLKLIENPTKDIVELMEEIGKLANE